MGKAMATPVPALSIPLANAGLVAASNKTAAKVIRMVKIRKAFQRLSSLSYLLLKISHWPYWEFVGFPSGSAPEMLHEKGGVAWLF
jgi:hypothetical protein